MTCKDKLAVADIALRAIAFHTPTVCYEHDDRRYVDIEEVFALKKIAASARPAQGAGHRTAAGKPE